MKRLFTLFCAAGLLLALAACGRQAEEPASTLKPHVFSAETETIIDLPHHALVLRKRRVGQQGPVCRQPERAAGPVRLLSGPKRILYRL